MTKNAFFYRTPPVTAAASITSPYTDFYNSLQYFRVIYKTRNTKTGNEMRGTRGIFTRIPGNFLEDSGECCHFSIPGNAQEDSRECSDPLKNRLLGKRGPQGLKMLPFFSNNMKDNDEVIHFHIKRRGWNTKFLRK